MQKRKEKIENFEKDNQKLKQKLDKNKSNTPEKPSPSEIERVKDEILTVQKNLKIMLKKNRNVIKTQEKEKFQNDLELKSLQDRLEEVNKLYRINLHKVSENERRIKYSITDRKANSQFNSSQKGFPGRGAHSQVRASNYNKFRKSGSKRRDLSAVNLRNPASKAYGNTSMNMNNSYMNNSMETSSTKAYGLKSNISKDQIGLKNPPKIEKINNKVKIKNSIGDEGVKETKTELRELKGLKNGQKQQIDTSVHL